MLFAHIADCHIGAWKSEKLRKLNLECFKEAIKTCINRKVDFLLISGDLFNTALPQIEYLKQTVEQLKILKDNQIRVYIIPGSHDFSPSGKTILDVLEKAELVKNVMQYKDHKLTFTEDPSGAKITGIYGRKGGLDNEEYQMLDKPSLENEQGFKIFMFHTTLEEFKPIKELQGLSSNLLPNNFQYYAGGHVHYIFKTDFNGGKLTYPGALFPNNFKELEEWQHGGLYLCDENLNLEYVPIQLKKVLPITLNLNTLTPEQATELIKTSLPENTEDKILTVRIKGEIDGKPSEIDFKPINKLPSFTTLRNTAKLKSKQSIQSELKQGTVEQIESQHISETQTELNILELMETLDKEKHEGEKVKDFEQRIISEVSKVLTI